MPNLSTTDSTHISIPLTALVKDSNGNNAVYIIRDKRLISFLSRLVSSVKTPSSLHLVSLKVTLSSPQAPNNYKKGRRLSMKQFNLAEWALKHKSIIYYFMAVLLTFGIFSFTHMGRMEDPDFTMRTMVVGVAWPGLPLKKCRIR